MAIGLLSFLLYNLIEPSIAATAIFSSLIGNKQVGECSCWRGNLYIIVFESRVNED